MHTPGPWDYVPSTEHHGPYVVAEFGGDVCDCYTMSNLAGASIRNGGDSKPVHFHGQSADANARLIASAPDLLTSLQEAVRLFENYALLVNPEKFDRARNPGLWVNAARAIIAKAEGK